MSAPEQMTILLVDDEAVIAGVAAKTIRKSGYEVIAAHSGEKTVRLAVENKNINLILMDINLGKGIDGAEAARQILSKRTMPIVFLAYRAMGHCSRHHRRKRIKEDLRTHQIELTMQNEELLYAQKELEVSRTRYFDLYDLAPVGYFALSDKGLILEANLAAAALLGVVRGALIKLPLSRFILPEDQDIYYRLRAHLTETNTPRTCELRMVRGNGASFQAHLRATAPQVLNDAPFCLVTVIETTLPFSGDGKK